MLNNKGQVLVIFIIILPVILLLLTLIVDLGMISVEKKKLDNNVYDAVKYYLDTNNEEKTKELLKSNLSDIKININDNEDYVEIEVIDNYKTFYKFIDSGLSIKYKGYKDSKKIIKG